MLPQKGVKCHKTFARPDGPLECRTLVCDHGCRLWKRVTLIDRHPETGAEVSVDSYDCLDSQQELYWKDMLRRQVQTTATVDKLSKEVKQANDAGMASALMGINGQLRDIASREPTALAHIGEPKLIEGS